MNSAIILGAAKLVGWLGKKLVSGGTPARPSFRTVKGECGTWYVVPEHRVDEFLANIEGGSIHTAAVVWEFLSERPKYDSVKNTFEREFGLLAEKLPGHIFFLDIESA